MSTEILRDTHTHTYIYNDIFTCMDIYMFCVLHAGLRGIIVTPAWIEKKRKARSRKDEVEM